MKKFTMLLVSLLLVGYVAVSMASQNSTSRPNDGVFIHVSHGVEDPHRLLMALSMANIMADDHDVLVYFDIEAIDAILKTSENVQYSHFPGSKNAIKSLVAKKAHLMACPGCLKAKGKTRDELLQGIRIADKETFFSFSKGRIITLDY